MIFMLFQKNTGQNERRKKLRKNNGRSIFKRRKGKLRKNLNKVDNNKIKDSEQEETDRQKTTEEEKKELTPGDGRCKYSSGKINGLEKCIGCGVGYRYVLVKCHVTIFVLIISYEI